MHERLAVYVPNEDAPEVVGLALKHIDKGSGIVGIPADEYEGVLPAGVRDARTLIYYEGNRYGASNMVTFADRCYFAASRLIERYPTVAQAAVPTHTLTQAGWYYPSEKRVEIRDVHDMIAVAHWLGLDVTSDQLRRELLPEGVRA